MADSKKLAELRSIPGAEAFAYDPNVPYDRLDDKSISVIAACSTLSEVGRMYVDDIRNSQAEFGPVSIRELRRGDGRFGPMRLLRQFASAGDEYLPLLTPHSPNFDPDIVEIWRSVRIPDVACEWTRVAVRVSALVVRPNGFFFFEYRNAKKLYGDSRYGQIEGKWDSPNLRLAASRYGIGYKLVTDEAWENSADVSF